MSANRSKYPKKAGFQVPENYFDEVENRLLQRMAEEKDVNLPHLNHGFKVPDGYFENLEERILESQKEQTGVISIFRKKYLYYAASVAAIFILMWIAPIDKESKSSAIGWDDVEVTTIENYIMEGYETGYIDMDASEFSDLFPDNDQLVDDSDFEKVNSDVVIDYIEENVDDPSDIIE